MRDSILDLYNEAIMTKTAIIIVEGSDDVPIYDKICNSINAHYEVIAAENIDLCESGCRGVIRAINEILSLEVSNYNPSDYIIGIVDKDVKDFRGEIVSNSMILTLNYYSVESHFFSSNVIEKLLFLFTSATRNLTDSISFEYITTCMQEKIDKLFIMSLDALRGAVDCTYSPVSSYSETYWQIIKPQALIDVDARRETLLEFARQYNICESLESLKKICKGKWLLDMFCHEILLFMRDLSMYCRSATIIQCQFCANSTHDKCLYLLNHKPFKADLIKKALLNMVDIPDLDYIRDRVGHIKAGRT